MSEADRSADADDPSIDGEDGIELERGQDAGGQGVRRERIRFLGFELGILFYPSSGRTTKISGGALCDVHWIFWFASVISL